MKICAIYQLSGVGDQLPGTVQQSYPQLGIPRHPQHDQTVDI
jgi:hypothetical protein